MQSKPVIKSSHHELQRENLIKSADCAALYEREFKTGNEEQSENGGEAVEVFYQVKWCQTDFMVSGAV